MGDTAGETAKNQQFKGLPDLRLTSRSFAIERSTALRSVSGRTAFHLSSGLRFSSSLLVNSGFPFSNGLPVSGRFLGQGQLPAQAQNTVGALAADQLEALQQ